MIMEAERSHDLPSARKANDVTHLETKGLSPRPPTGKAPRASSAVQQKSEPILPSYVFCSFQSLSGLDDAHPHEAGQSAFESLTQMLASSGNTTQTRPEVSSQVPGRPVTRSSCHIKLSTIVGPYTSSLYWNSFRWVLLVPHCPDDRCQTQGLHLVLCCLAPCFYPAAAPSSRFTVKE